MTVQKNSMTHRPRQTHFRKNRERKFSRKQKKTSNFVDRKKNVRLAEADTKVPAALNVVLRGPVEVSGARHVIRHGGSDGLEQKARPTDVTAKESAMKVIEL